MKTNRISRCRTGFTLVEMLVVIAIIAVLASLISAAVMKTRTLQQVKTTEDTLRKLQSSFDQQRLAVLDTAAKGPIPTQVLALAAGDPDRAKSLWAYLKYKRAFPETFAEAKSNLTIVDTATNTNITLLELNAPAIFNSLPAGPGNASADVQAGACAYLFMSKRAERGMVSGADEAAGSLRGEIAVLYNGNNFNVQIFNDTMGSPITFRRFYTAAELNSVPYIKIGSVNLDPFDPLGKLRTYTNAETTIRNQAHRSIFGNDGAFTNANFTGTFYSAGLNKTFGNADDLFGYRVRMGQ